MFNIGQKVVCIDNDGASQLVLNAIYTVRRIIADDGGNWRGRPDSTPAIILYEAKHERGCVGFASPRFRPAVERKTDISIFKKLLTPAPQHGPHIEHGITVEA